MPKVPSGTDVVKVLVACGFAKASQKGSHVKMKHPDGRIAIVPIHDEIAKGTLASIARQSGVSAERLRGE